MKKYGLILAVLAVGACQSTSAKQDQSIDPKDTPTVAFIETLDVYSAPHKDSFLNQLAMNYRSYALYNQYVVLDATMSERFAQKAVVAFSGEVPMPESMAAWPVADNKIVELTQACDSLIDVLRKDASYKYPGLAAEAQSKFDCWLTAESIGNDQQTAMECKDRFMSAMDALLNNMESNKGKKPAKDPMYAKTKEPKRQAILPDTRSLDSMNYSGRARESIVIVNNINVPENLIKPQPVPPIVFEQNIINNAKTNVTCGPNGEGCPMPEPVQPREVYIQPDLSGLTDGMVSRDEFINMMMALRQELADINSKVDNLGAETAMTLKVQQIPTMLEPKQHIMEEIFEVHFDFDKSKIKPEYEDVIHKLAATTQANKNVKVSVVGHTDTVGGKDYNFALGGRRAEEVQKMLVKYGIPKDQIVVVSAGKNDNKVPTGDGVKNADNRRVRVVKEVHYTEQPKPAEPRDLQVYVTSDPRGQMEPEVVVEVVE